MEVSLIVCRYSWSHSFPVARIACKGGRKLPRSDTRLGWPQGGDRLTGDNSTPIIRPPKPTLPMTQHRVPSEPLSEKPKESACDPSYYDPLLIASCDRTPLLLLLLLKLKDGRDLVWNYSHAQLSLSELGTLYLSNVFPRSG